MCHDSCHDICYAMLYAMLCSCAARRADDVRVVPYLIAPPLTEEEAAEAPTLYDLAGNRACRV
jgi:hypothetical protein